MKCTDQGSWHLVCGGSRGIGYAFAESLASRRQNLIVVARNRSDLGRARNDLIAAGAPKVIIRSADLLDASSRRRLIASLDSFSLRSVLVGGPSPPAGPLSSVSPKSLDHAFEICLGYPFHLVERLLGRCEKVRPAFVFYISSSAAAAPAAHPTFYLSGLLRKATEQLLRDLVSHATGRGCRLAILRPRLVWTSLSEKYARARHPKARPELLRSLLASELHTQPQDPEIFLNAALKRAALSWNEVAT
jgi:NAD(P)-dependent dehydrogenase (short-subunit alcohol dehydrogenase family)